MQSLQNYTFISRYARFQPELKRRETWNEAVDRVRDMHLRRYPQIADEINWAFELMRDKKVLGSQRALQFGGKAIENNELRIYNCLGANTSFVTSYGVKTFKDFNDGDIITVLTHTGHWQKATVKHYGKQKVNKITIKRGGATYQIEATNNHRWILNNGDIIEHLRIEDKLLFAPDIFNNFVYDNAPVDEQLYWAYGFVYGDGTKVKNRDGKYTSSMVRLCGNDIKYVSRFEDLGFSSSSSLSIKGDIIVCTGKYLKTTPNPQIDEPRLIRAFVSGFLDADGAKNSNCRKTAKYPSINRFKSIQATGQDPIDFIRMCFPIAGIYIVSEKDLTGQETNFGIRKKTISFRIINSKHKNAHLFTVNNIEEGNIKDVWCLEVENDNSFILPFGLVTGNCSASYCDRLRFFQEAFYALLAGVGTGFSVQKHHIDKLPPFQKLSYYNKLQKTFIIPDSIEGWADSVGILLSSYFENPIYPEYQSCEVKFDYSQIRPEGSTLSSSSGKAPGPRPLRNALEAIVGLLERCLGNNQSKLRPIDAYDIVMYISGAVLSGGIRRSASLSVFSPDDLEMAKAKTDNWFIENPQRSYSNNSALLLRNKTKFDDFKKLMQYVKEFGEPGFVWTDNINILYNPCLEIALNPVCQKTYKSGWQMCNLPTINGKAIQTNDDFIEAAKAAAIIGTCQAGYTNFPYLGKISEEITKREALLGVSITGMMENPEIFLNIKLQQKAATIIKQINHDIAIKININPAARTTCVKPEGSTSTLLGTSSGIHPYHSKRYLRKVQANKMELPAIFFQKHNPIAIEKSVYNKNGDDLILNFCIEVEDSATIKSQISALSLLEIIKNTQINWIQAGKNLELCTQPWLNHSVSNTIHVKDDEWEAVTDFIYNNRQYFAGVALLSMHGDLDYAQAPFTKINTSDEILEEYGDGALLAGGMIEDALEAYDNDLWKACNIALNGKDNKDLNLIDHWTYKMQKFARKYFNNDMKKACYCLKEVYNFKKWIDIRREYVDVDYTQMIETENHNKFEHITACGGGRCEI